MLMAIMFSIVISFRISSFGINPDSGGSPPSERRDSISKSMDVGEVVQASPKSVIVFDSDISRIINEDVVIVI